MKDGWEVELDSGRGDGRRECLLTPRHQLAADTPALLTAGAAG